MSLPLKKSLAELFCEQHAVLPADFERVLVEHSPDPRAHAMRRLLQRVPGDFFGADFEFARKVGRLNQASDFTWEVSEFPAHPSNRRTQRRMLEVHLSLSRLRRIVNRTFAEPAGATRTQRVAKPASITLSAKNLFVPERTEAEHRVHRANHAVLLCDLCGWAPCAL